jgi:hypothetical protein
VQEVLKTAHEWMADYMKSFYHEDKNIMHGIQMKEIHTGYVTDIARDLAKYLKLDEHDVQLAELMGLLHDVGRFHQWTIYQTFNDADSEDHADLGVKVIVDLPFYDMLNDEEKDYLLFAIKNHNKKEIAPAPSEKHLMFAKLLRDADKLDIYRVLEPYLGPTDNKGFAPGFVEKFVAGEQVDYTKMQTQDDRKLVRLMWVYDINYSWTMKRLMERGYIDKIINNLMDTPEVRKGVERLRKHVDKLLAMDTE